MQKWISLKQRTKSIPHPPAAKESWQPHCAAKYNDMIARRYFCQLAYTNFGESDWAVTFTYDHGHQPAPGDFDQVDRDWTNFTRRLKRFCKKMGREASKWMQVAEYSVVDEDGKVTGRHHHHAILQGNLTWQEIKDLWRDSTGRPMGLVKLNLSI